MTDGGFAITDVAGGGADRPPEQRGTLDLHDRAVVRIVEGAARAVPGSVAHTGALGGLAGSSYPRAQVDTGRGRLWVRLDVAATWPGDTAATARRVAERVRAETARLTGMSVVSVDVTVHLVDRPQRTERSLA